MRQWLRFSWIAWLAWLICCWAAMPAIAGVGADSAGRFQASGLQSFQGRFAQTLYDNRGRVLERSEGSVSMHFPGRFRWIYESPYEQSIIGDGKVVWIHDVGLEQVIVRSMDAASNAVPSAILSGDPGQWERHFLMEGLGEIDGLSWQVLKPRDPDSEYEWIRIGFANALPMMMIFKDALEQILRIDFSDAKLDAHFPVGHFSFQIPDGLDVIDERP